MMITENKRFRCPFCNEIVPIISTTEANSFIYFSGSSISHYGFTPGNHSYPKDLIRLIMRKCPACGNVSVLTTGLGSQYKDVTTYIHPKSKAIQFPNYVPQQIREDYEEAYAILHLSPKASATLSRRCLQGMIRNFFQVTDSSLFKEIDDISDKVSPTIRKALHSVRKIGNIGAHMEKNVNLILDISDGEAEKLLKLIELLIKNWYIEKHDAETLINDIEQIDSNLQDQRHDKNS